MTAAFVTRALLSGFIIAMIALIGRKAPTVAGHDLAVARYR